MENDKIHISTDILINAKKEDVWKVLADIENWPTWTSIILSVKGTFAKDGTLTLEFANPAGGSITFERKIFLFEEGQAFGWTGEALAGLHDHHIHRLETLPDGETKFTQADGLNGAEVEGIGVMEQQMEAGYKIFNQQLKTFVEANYEPVA